MFSAEISDKAVVTSILYSVVLIPLPAVTFTRVIPFNPPSVTSTVWVDSPLTYVTAGSVVVPTGRFT